MSTRTPLDDVEFLARSPHRVEVLKTLSTGPWTRPDLRDETGISQPTLGRVLGSLRDHNWVEQRGREYALTSLGELLVEEFGNLLDTVETIQLLGDVVQLLPTEEMDFDIRRLGSATITTPATGDVLRHVRLAEELFYEADDLRILADTIAPGSLEQQRERVVNFRAGDQRVESIITGDALDQAFADPELVEWTRDLIESGRAPVYRYDGTIPLTLAIADGTAVLFPSDEHGFPAALIETTDEQVCSWVSAQIDHYREAATQLAVEDLPV